MKLTGLFMLVVMAVLSLLAGSAESAPKVNVNAIKKGGHVIGKGLRAINIASTAHDVYSALRPKRKKH
ncbi:virescein-like [Zerene cesonia]|uniref:virescein-like n=1 Tax=Zerene cesonia TaxID=33412 RepID=UPI0018E55150|nr:virescein-like [Zerene cesonia]